jgi:hypothetical protein
MDEKIYHVAQSKSEVTVKTKCFWRAGACNGLLHKDLSMDGKTYCLAQLELVVTVKKKGFYKYIYEKEFHLHNDHPT